MQILQDEIGISCQRVGKNIIYNGTTYYFKQIAKNSIYIGIKKYQNNFMTSTNQPFVISGQPKYITEIRNLGWKGAFLEFIPAYSVSKEFSETITEINTIEKPNRTVSPTLTFIGSSTLPCPAAITIPFKGFSFAVSGMKIPLAVFCSAGAGSIRTLSARGLKFIDIYNYFIL